MIIYVHRYHKFDLLNNPKVKYIFGDNTKRVGRGGQAAACRDMENAIGVATKLLPSQCENSYFSDDNVKGNARIMYEDLKPAFDHVINGGVLVMPLDGIGTGLSDLPNKAPLTNLVLERMLNNLVNVDNKIGVELRSKTYLKFQFDVTTWLNTE